MLTLRGEFKQETEKKEVTYSICKQYFVTFEHSVMLPTDVQTEKANADFENGILTIIIPNAEAVKSKTINIKVK